MTDVEFSPTPELLATPLVWSGVDGRIQGANPAFCRWLGVSVRRLLGQPLVSLEAQGEVLAQRLAHRPSGRAAIDFIGQIADGDRVIARGRARRPHRRLSRQTRQNRGHIEPDRWIDRLGKSR